jgi:hypothetical protein
MLARSDRFAGNVSCLAIIFSGPSRDGPSTLGVHACLLLEQAGIFLVRRACAAAWGCKSPAQPDGGEGLVKRKGVVARRGLKEAYSKTTT